MQKDGENRSSSRRTATPLSRRNEIKEKSKGTATPRKVVKRKES